MGRATRWALREIHVKGRWVAAVKKAALKACGTRHARRLSGFAYALFDLGGGYAQI
jgi:hypothetical protein